VGLVHQTTIERVRLRQARVEAPVARLRLSYMLSSVSFRPPVMPPGAVLIVRSMADPLPGRIAKKFDAGVLASGEWERAARSRLTGLYRNAARPARDVVSPSCDAVLFADWGEILACCARDVVQGNTNAWWWRSVARRFSLRITQSVAGVWHDYPRYVPAALQLLSERGEAASVVERIPSPQAWHLLLAVLRDSGLFHLANIVSECLREQGGPHFQNSWQASSLRGVQSIGLEGLPSRVAKFERRDDALNAEWDSSGESFIAAPWEPYVSAHVTPASLGAGRRALLGISLLLRRNLKFASGATFSSRLRRWLTHAIAQERAALPENSRPAVNTPGTALRSVFANPLDQPDTTRIKRGTGISVSDFVGASVKAKFQPVDRQNPAHLEDASTSQGRLTEPTRVAASISLENGELTRAAGVFYLIHFLRESELFELDVGLSGWALLELLARCLLDSAWNGVCDDPIWTALALLDGRDPGTPPGSDFQPQTTYGAPKSWLRGLDASALFTRFHSNRVEMWHGEGFLTLDSPAREHLDKACRPVSRTQKRAWRQAARICGASMPLSKPLRRFLHFALPYARWRLRSALCGASLKEILLRSGMLYVTRTHIDLVMSLNQIHTAARFSGLDSNPGWVPELGHVITFHFDEELGRG
jgi:hypothetical protein